MNSVQNPSYDQGLADSGLDARFRRAARHSRMVRILRVAVPAAVVVAMAGIVFKAFFNEYRIPINTGNLSGNMVVSGSKITMETPHLTGYTPDQRPYDLVAKSATQDLADPNHVTLNKLRAKVLMEDRSTVTLDALTGVFDTKQQLLDLRKDILMTTSSGYEARLSQAFVDMGKGIVTSDEHVDIKLTNGTLSADHLKITDNGDVIRFDGNVVMHLDNVGDSSSPVAAAEASADPAQAPRTRPVAKSTTAK